MKRYLGRGICCMGAALLLFLAEVSPVRAEEHSCGSWVVDNVTEDCRTPICDGVHLTGYRIYETHKTCTYTPTNYTYTIPNTYTQEGGCCTE